MSKIECIGTKRSIFMLMNVIDQPSANLYYRIKRSIFPYLVGTISLLFSVLICTSILNAQYYFGRNKIQYNQFKWRVLKTEHFDIYFYEEMQELASIGAAFAEEAYQDLQVKFDHTVKRRIPLIFYSSHFHFEETNITPYFLPEGVGGFFEYIKGRVVIPANGSLSQFRQVIFHELVHVFTHSKLSNVFQNTRNLNWSGFPLWFTEGLAEFWSAGWNKEADMFIRDAVINNYIVPLENIYQINGTFLMYKEGQMICRYIAETYGEHKLLQLFEDSWKTDNFSHLLKLVIGKDYHEFDQEWLYNLKKSYYPLLKEGDIPGQVSDQLTRDGFNTKPAFVRLNGEAHVVFHSNRMGYSGIYIRKIPSNQEQGEKPEILIKGERTPEIESFHLLRSKLDVSRDGRLVFIAKNQGKDAIFVYDLNSRVILQKLQYPDLIYLSSPAWDREGKRIAFTAIDFSGKSDLFVVSTEDKKLCRLTNDFYDDRDPDWAPDGQSVVFSSDRGEYGKNGAYNIFQMDLGTFDIRYITSGNFHDYAPVFSPQGKYLAFSSDRDGSFNIWIIQAGKRLTLPRTRVLAEYATIPAPEIELFYSVLDDIQHESRVIQQPLLKKATDFVTGSFDPEWTDDGSLLFTALENFSFQLRKLEKIPQLFQKKPKMAYDVLPPKLKFWSVPWKPFLHSSTTVHYKRKYSLDIAQSYVTQDPIFGTYGGAQLAISDMLGNNQWYFLVYNDATTKDELMKSLNVAVTYLDLSRRLNLAYGTYHLAGRFFNYADGFFYERRYGGFIGISYPFSVFRRIEASLNVRNSERDWFSRGYFRKAFLISNFFSLVEDNSLWGPTGPLDGHRYNITIGNTVDIRHSNVNFYTLIFDYRAYIRLSRRISYATRVAVNANLGKETIKFFMGGSWDLRGYKLWSIWGEKLVFFSQELRVPFIDRLLFRFPFGSIQLSGIRGAAFVDMGNAWNGRFRELLGSYGVGARVNLGGFLVLRLDYGKKFTLNFSGSRLLPRSFHIEGKPFLQFFFGWDF